MVESLDLEYFGRKHLRRIYRNLPTSVLYEEIINNREGQVAHLGPIVVRTGHYAELPPEDKFFVKDPYSEKKIFWSEEKNELSENHFNYAFPSHAGLYAQQGGLCAGLLGGQRAGISDAHPDCD